MPGPGLTGREDLLDRRYRFTEGSSLDRTTAAGGRHSRGHLDCLVKPREDTGGASRDPGRAGQPARDSLTRGPCQVSTADCSRRSSFESALEGDHHAGVRIGKGALAEVSHTVHQPDDWHHQAVLGLHP